MLFSKETYVQRRRELMKLVGDGIIVLLGNNDSPMNYPANCYKFRQDSSFLYFTGQHRQGLALVLDCNSGEEIFIGDDIDLDDIIWYGSVQSVADMATECGIAASEPMARLWERMAEADSLGRTVHILPPYRHDHILQLGGRKASLTLIKAVVALRSIKSAEEIAELDRISEVGYKMHTTAMSLCREGATETYIAGVLDGIAASYGSIVSFQSIVTTSGEILHNTPLLRPLEAGKLLLVDAGAESLEHYCSDHTRTMPVSGKFTSKQLNIYNIVKECHDYAMSIARPGVRWYDVHLEVCRIMLTRLSELGLVRGSIDDALEAGAYGLFLPHGLGHMMGMDVHDMEGLGQVYVGYDDETRPSDKFGLGALRFGRRLEPGHVVTDEPGIYFIPALIDFWKTQGAGREFINFDEVDKYRDFGGIRLEDDVLITKEGARFLGEHYIPIEAEEVEERVGR